MKATARSVTRALFGLCPSCGRERLFVGLFRTIAECPNCAVRHERMEGTWALAAGFSAMVGLSFGCFITVWWYRQYDETIGAGLPLVSSALLMGISYRLGKATLFGLLYRAGLVTEDPERDGNVLFMDRILRRRERSDRDRDAG